jgi:DNA segregation ATPase FtsK/SpoIIIE, S-DNA-T family
MAQKNSPVRKPAAKKSPARSTRSRKQPGGGVLANSPLRHWSLKSLSIDRKLDILGVVLALVGLLTILSLASASNGAVTGWWILSIKKIAGLGSFILPIVLILVGIWLVLRNVERLPMLSLERITGLFLLFLNVLAWLHMLLGGGWELADKGNGGGYLGAISQQALVSALGDPGTYIVLAAWTLIAVALTLDISVSELFHFFQTTLASLAHQVKMKVNSERELLAERKAIAAGSERVISELPPEFKPLGPARSASGSAATPTSPPAAEANSRERARNPRGTADPSQSGTPADVSFEAPGAASTVRPSTVRKGSSAAATTAQPAPLLPPWKVPDIADILDPFSQELVKSSQDLERGQLIVETLASFGAPVKIVATNHGPTVTQFGVEPLYIENRNGQTRVRVAKIVALADDLALALAAPRIRIQAPVPGRNYVGIEVPNLDISRVLLREVMESEAYRKLKSPLRFALGKDVAGHPKVYDLAGMPHLLIAGTTGSGKSVCVNSILSCLLLNNTPNELRMILVDPKRVELTGYNGIPHLLAPVVVEAEQVVGALQWVQREMDARYHRFSQVGARNIVDYNSRNSPAFPYMLVLIDELADLMMLAPDETERSLSRLAQLARATGIHLVLATQRPSVDVVTGLIKANFPARIAFAVASGIDSRVILDQPGAERLLGRGDMLFQAPDAAAPVRVQGVFVDDSEIQRLVDYWRQQAYELRDTNIHSSTAVPINMDLPLNTPLKQTPLWGDDENGRPGDPVLPDAIKIVREEGKASISMLQRKMRIGYTRAARLIDQLEERGVIGPSVSTSLVREVLDMGEGNNAETKNNLEANDIH